MKARVENHNTLIRDLNNNAILNVDTTSIEKSILIVTILSDNGLIVRIPCLTIWVTLIVLDLPF